MINTSRRSEAIEIMDDFEMEGEILRDALDKIARINQLLGGNKVTLQGVKKLIRTHSKAPLRVLDVGCGNGDMLRKLADFAAKQGLTTDLLGIDANPYTVQHAKTLSKNYKNIHYRTADIFEEMNKENTYDIILCTLTLHHFTDQEILFLLGAFSKLSRLGIVINDLHRSSAAYYLFKALCFVFGLNDMSREDGLISILKGFKKRDLQNFSKQLYFKHDRIQWRWAFRYQWIIQTYEH
ncbi:methyltransferase domain-containing protein [Pedobacter sp.]|jgi:2-polyprenyl-3-methyl-5-hydroxy-6-metoxy-1,4-benzoquinol methylase|uniref:methyltransferase domain-containing protein n=1 Tax=Pedobacter sp. TaxID=1411316 RepID=UPI002B7C2A75|nr:methyltransferase domain-containing protein [Pedobacter sp.]HWW38398.1 methyltransferase domain-containing protein [Pedobacter sp.]